MEQEKTNKIIKEEISALEKEIEQLKKENRERKIRIERKNLELQKYWLKILGFKKEERYEKL